MRAGYTAWNLTWRQTITSADTYNPVMDELTILEGHHFHSRLVRNTVCGKVYHYTIHSSREFYVKSALDLKNNSITSIEIAVVGSTKLYIAVSTLWVENCTISLVLSEPTIEYSINFVPKTSIYQEGISITSWLDRLCNHRGDCLLEICNWKFGEYKLGCETLKLSNETVTTDDRTARFIIVNFPMC